MQGASRRSLAAAGPRAHMTVSNIDCMRNARWFASPKHAHSSCLSHNPALPARPPFAMPRSAAAHAAAHGPGRRLLQRRMSGEPEPLMKWLVDKHNELRGRHGVPFLAWDWSLAWNAYDYVSACPTGHSGASGIGENLAWGHHDFNHAMRDWYDEVRRGGPTVARCVRAGVLPRGGTTLDRRQLPLLRALPAARSASTASASPHSPRTRATFPH